ncbi:TadE/TadG family type IV pilus assembly protein [Nocardioides marmoriginsengisoli]|uniref:TadE/TadG family type IV pilus assembly protein n=1 Tax=Nocardioides marmoriginsengisoli TaxID=661483 RepID=UPI00160A2A3C|nr:TadE/TadG family type IV pilus assembly protein [Nocardioides marmoriginsengisoli]
MRRRRDESGAIAIMFGLLAVVLMGIAALGVDFASQVNERQKLQDSMDAGAQAGAYQLPTNGMKSQSDAIAFAKAADATSTPDVDYFCVVGSIKSGSAWVLDASQIPGVCNPASSKLGSVYTGLRCGPSICSIPCRPLSGDLCNTIRLTDARDVPFTFARALGIDQGSTGATQSVACKGSCGTIPPNPLDVAIVADRTGSMSSTDRAAMVTGIKGMLKVMTPSQQYVALGTIGRAGPSAPSSCKSSPTGSTTTTGPWIPTPFTTGYLNAAGTDVNTSNQLVKDVNCLTASSTGTSLAAPFKSAARYLLGSAVGATNNLGSLPARNSGTPRKVLIFETDGQPNETAATAGTPSLSSSSDLFSNSDSVTTSNATVGPVANPVTVTTTVGSGSLKITINTTTTYNTTTKTTTNTYVGGQNACTNLGSVAANAKAAGILVVTIAYNLSGITCDLNNPNPPAPTSTTVDSAIIPVSDVLVGKVRTILQTVNRTITRTVWVGPTGEQVTGVLANVASPTADGAPSVNDKDCGTTTGRDAENSDGDYFFCAASGTDMAPIFKTALSQASAGIKLIRLP